MIRIIPYVARWTLTAVVGSMVCAGALAQTPAGSANPSISTQSQADAALASRRTVIEDDATRIEELRVRGQTERVVVTPKKVNLPSWEIRPDIPGRTGAVDGRLPRDGANKRMWSVLAF